LRADPIATVERTREFDERLFIQNPLLLTAVAVAGCVAGLVLLGAGNWYASCFLNTSAGRAWATLLSVMMGSWAISLVPLWTAVQALYRIVGLPRPVVAVTLVYVALLALPFAAAKPPALASHPELLFRPGCPAADFPVAYFTARYGVILFFGMLLGGLGVVGIFLGYTIGKETLTPAVTKADPLAPIATGVESRVHDLETERAQIELYLWLRRLLQRTFWLLGTAVAGAIVTSGVLRYGIVTWTGDRSVYPIDEFWTFGGYFAVLLALAYVPSYLALNGAGQRLRGAYYDLIPPSADGFETRQRQRQGFDDLLGLRLDVIGSVKQFSPILAPLVGSLVAALLVK
jgi:hypothetical protein